MHKVKLLATLVALCTTIQAWADGPTPVAVWNGDFSTKTISGYTLDENGNTVADNDSSITISGTTGIKIVVPSNTQQCSVIVKYSGLTLTDGDTRAMITLGGGNNDANSYKDHMGVCVAGSTRKVSGVWERRRWTNRDNNSGTAPTAGTMAFVYKYGETTRGYADGSVVYNADTALQGAAIYVKNIGIGGKYSGDAAPSGQTDVTPASNMIVEAIAVFSDKLTDDQVAAYQFPEPEDPTEIVTTYTHDQYLTSSFVETNWDFSLDDISKLAFSGTMDGAWVNTKGAAATGYNVTKTDTGLVKVQMQIIDGNSDKYVKCVEVELQKNENGKISVRASNVGHVAASSGLGYNFTSWGDTLATSATADGYGVATLSVSVTSPSGPNPTSKTFNITGDVSYDNLETDGLTKVTLNLTGDATVTFPSTPTAALTFTGAHKLTVKGAEKLNLANVTDSAVTALTYEFDGAITADDTLKTKIKAAPTTRTFVFTGDATVDFGQTNLGTLNTHLVFRGDASTLKVWNGNNKFGANATYDNPTVLVESGTLTFYGHDVTGWAAGTDANGIVRVKNGAKLQLENYGSGTFYYNQRIAIDAGATVTVGSSLNGNQFRMTEGVNTPQIWVQDSDSDMASNPAKLVLTSGMLALAKDGSAQGIGVYVGRNAKLQITGTINSMNNAGTQAPDNNFARTIKKTGAGVLEISGTHGATYEVAEGSIGGDATVKKLTVSSGAIAIDSAKAITVETQLTLPKPVKLVGTPAHGMTVVNVPTSFEGTDYTATLNGASEPVYELYLEDSALKLKYKTPPALAEENGEVGKPALTTDGTFTGGEVAVTISNFTKGSYAEDGALVYKLVFPGREPIIGSLTSSKAKLLMSLASEDLTYETVKVYFDLDKTFTANNVYRGQLVVEYMTNGQKDGEVVLGPVTVYEGKQTYVPHNTWVNETPNTIGQSGKWVDGAEPSTDGTTGTTASITASSGAMVVNSATGVTFTPTNTLDYVESCDSTFIVKIAADEAVAADADDGTLNGVQGGVRIVENNGNGAKLQFVVNNEWSDGDTTPIAAMVGQMSTIEVCFHYCKGGDDADCVTYNVLNTDGTTNKTVRSTQCATGVKKMISNIFVADGTKLAEILGACELDKAVVIDVEIQEVTAGGTVALTATDEASANAEIANMIVGLSEEVATVVTDADAYKSYLKIVAKQQLDGKWVAMLDFVEGKATEIKSDLEKALATVVANINAESDADYRTFTGKPGLYYGVVRGDELNALTVQDEMVLANSSGDVKIIINKPEHGDKHFYRVICSPVPLTATPATK